MHIKVLDNFLVQFGIIAQIACCNMYAVVVLVVLLVQNGVLAFFDLSDIEDPFSIFWSHKSKDN